MIQILTLLWEASTDQSGMRVSWLVFSKHPEK